MKKLISHTVLALSLLITSCGSVHSKWTKEEVQNKITGCCFTGIDSNGGEQTTIFNNDETWKTFTNAPGQPTYGEDNGTWSVKEFNKKYDWWVIDMHNGQTTTLGTTKKAGKTQIYISGFGSVSRATKE